MDCIIYIICVLYYTMEKFCILVTNIYKCRKLWINMICTGITHGHIMAMTPTYQSLDVKISFEKVPSFRLHSPTRCWCSSACGSVRFRSCWSNKGYLRILCIGFMRYDSSVEECCWRGFLAERNSWSAWLPSSEKVM